MALVLLLFACSPGSDRDLTVVGPGEDSPTQWTPTDTGQAGDTGAGSIDMQVTADCGADTGSFSDIEDALSVRSCVRISPEDGDAPDSSITGGSSVAPPCGFYNLVGAVALVGSAPRLRALYCDSDPGGGLRYVEFDGESGEVLSRLLAEDSCLAAPDSGDILLRDDGAIIAWSTYDGAWTAHIDDDGVFLGGPYALDAPAMTMQLRLVDGDTPLLLAQDPDDQLWSIPLDADGRAAAEPALIATEVGSFAITGGDHRAAICTDPGWQVQVGRLDAQGLLTGASVLADATCFPMNEPGIASDGVGLAVSWDDAEVGGVAVLDGDLQSLAQLDLGEGARNPRVEWDGDQYVVADTLGVVRWLGPGGEQTGRWTHPYLARPEGEPYDLRFRVDEAGYTFAFVGYNSYSTPTGHIITYYYVELSEVAVP